MKKKIEPLNIDNPMAREARKQLADLRAMEEEHERMEMRGSGKHFIGAGATPSMGLSQFRGGARKSRSCSESEEEYEGGAIIPSTALIPYASRTLARVGPRAIVPYRGTTSTLATRGTRAIVPYRPTSTALATRGTRAVSTATAAQTASRGFSGLRGRITSGLQRGLTAQNIANAIALGVPLGMLGSYLADQANQSGEGGYFEDYAGEDFGPELDPSEPSPTGPYIPAPGPSDGGVPSDLSADELAFYLQSGNLPQRYAITTSGVKKGPRGRGKLTIEHEGGAMDFSSLFKKGQSEGKIAAKIKKLQETQRKNESRLAKMLEKSGITAIDAIHRKIPVTKVYEAVGQKSGGRVTTGYNKKQARGQAVAKIMRERGVSLPQASKIYAEMMRGKNL